MLLVPYLNAKIAGLKIATVFVISCCACVPEAQTYSMDRGTNPKAKTPAQTSAPAGQSLGWGSSIETARLARAVETALQRGDHALAFELAQRAVHATSNDASLWFLLGYAARLNQRLAESETAYRQGLRLHAGAAEGLSGLAQTLSLQGRNEEAETLLKQAIALNAARRDDMVLLGEIYLRTANYESAVEWLQRAEGSKPDFRTELLLASAYQHEKKLEMSGHYLEMAKQRAPENPEMLRSMAGYYRELGEYAEAVAALNAIHAPGVSVLAELAYTYQLTGNLEASARVYSQAANSEPGDVTLQLSAAQAEVAAGLVDRALPFLTRVESSHPKHYRLHAIRAEIDRIEGREQEAIAEYTTAVANLPAAPVEGALFGIQLHLSLMELYHGAMDEANAKGQLAIAEQEINALGERTTGRQEFLRLRATIRMHAGDSAAALRDVTDALALSATDRNSLQLEGDILMKLGRVADAVAAYSQILTYAPDNQFALTSLGYASRAAGRDKDAEGYFQHLARVYPNLYVPHLALGDLYTARKDFVRAQAAYNAAFLLEPKRALVMAGGINAAIEAHELALGAEWFGRVTPAMQQEPQIVREEERYTSFTGEYPRSAEFGEKAIVLLPMDRDVVVYLGYDLLHLNRYDELLQLTDKYRGILAKDADISLLAGYVHKHQGETQLALADFTEALARNPEVVTAYVNRGYLLNDTHEPEKAAEDFEEALKREPKNGEAHLGLAYSFLDLHEPGKALEQAEMAYAAAGDSLAIHVIRATAYGRQGMLTEAESEYRLALVYLPGDGTLHLGLGNALFAQSRFHEAIAELQIAVTAMPASRDGYALLARAWASTQDRAKTMEYVALAEGAPVTSSSNGSDAIGSGVYLSTGQALSVIGDHDGAMERFRKALTTEGSDRVSVRIAIARIQVAQGHGADAERQIALSQMEAVSGESQAFTAAQLLEAAEIFRTVHEYPLSLIYLERARAAGAQDADVRVGRATTLLAMGDTQRAEVELAGVHEERGRPRSYEFLLAQATLFRQQHNDAAALTSFAQAAQADGDTHAVKEAMLTVGADEGLRVSRLISVLSDVSVEPIFEDSTVYVLDSKLDAVSTVSGPLSGQLPPPRSSLQSQWTGAFHAHLNRWPTVTGFAQVRNARGEISVPSTASVVKRNTTDYTLNAALAPVLTFGNNTIVFNGGVQGTIRRDSESPVAMNQNLLRAFAYMSTSSFFNAVSVSGYVIRDAGPYTESSLHSQSLAGALDFRVGAPWSHTFVVTGWGANKQTLSPVRYESFVTSSYIGVEQRFGETLKVKAIAEEVRAWREVGTASAIAQNLRPAANVEWSPNHEWKVQVNSSYSNERGFHAYDAIQNGFSVSYARPFRRKFRGETGSAVIEYPIRFSAGVQQESFFNYTGGKSQRFEPFVQISIF